MAIFTSEDVDEKLAAMARDLRRASDLLEDNPEEAKQMVDGLSDGTGCDLCQQVETHALSAVMFASTAPEGFRGDALNVARDCLEQYASIMEGEHDGS